MIAAVTAPVATLWLEPGRVRPIDAPAVTGDPDVAGWTAGLDDDARRDLNGRAETQLLYGDPVEVLDHRAGWAQVIATGQPSGKDDRGYPGWLPEAQLGETAPAAGRPLIVAADRCDLRVQPDGVIARPGISYGTVLQGTGAATDGWHEVALPGSAATAWARAADVDTEPSTDRRGLVGEARRFLGLPYLWGGLSCHGFDCSGLVHAVCRRFGIPVPRDADDQAAACTQVPLSDVETGDLYFFARPGKGIHHVGFVVSPGVMLDAPRTGQRVRVAPLGDPRRSTLTAAGRIDTSRPIT